jgi:hypothetical protein
MGVGLVGAHRTGKTSLAKAYALKTGAKFLETSVSAINRELGFDCTKEHSFAERLDHQEKILVRLDAVYEAHVGVDYITDRTPLDLIAYTVAEAINDRVAEEDQERLARYVQDCIDVTNRRLGVVVLVQPGIPIVAEEGKAAANRAYIEHLNSLMLGLTVDERVKCAHFYLPRRLMTLNQRVEALEFSVGRVAEKTLQTVKESRESGTIQIH